MRETDSISLWPLPWYCLIQSAVDGAACITLLEDLPRRRRSAGSLRGGQWRDRSVKGQRLIISLGQVVLGLRHVYARPVEWVRNSQVVFIRSQCWFCEPLISKMHPSCGP